MVELPNQPIIELFCQKCGAPIRGTYPITCANCGSKTRLTISPVGVLIIPVIDWIGKGVLVGQRAIEPNKGGWALFGGFAAPGETTKQAAAREAKEEIDLLVNAEDLVYFGEAPSTNGDRILYFYVCPVIELPGESTLITDPNEISAIQVVYHPEVLTFSTHTEMLTKFLGQSS